MERKYNFTHTITGFSQSYNLYCTTNLFWFMLFHWHSVGCRCGLDMSGSNSHLDFESNSGSMATSLPIPTNRT